MVVKEKRMAVVRELRIELRFMPKAVIMQAHEGAN
jgi:hypothetical protein